MIFQICANDELVAKKFAYYIRESDDGGGLDEVDQFPVMLSSSILTLHSPARTVCTTSNNPTAQTQPPPGKHTDVTSCLIFEDVHEQHGGQR